MSKYIVKVQHHESIPARVLAKDGQGWFTTGNSSKSHFFTSTEEAEKAMKEWIPDNSEVKWQVEAV